MNTIITNETGIYRYVNAPIQMCNYVVKRNLESPFKLFVYLKIRYPSGKFNWKPNEKKETSQMLKVNVRTIRNNFKKIEELGWVKYHNEFNQWRLVSFDNLRISNDWSKVRSYSFTYYDVLNIRAALGGVTYTQLYKSSSRKHKRRKNNVLKNGSAIKIFTPPCDKLIYAEVSVIGVSKIFNISISKAVRLKKNAKLAGYIKVKKQYSIIPNDEISARMKALKMTDQRNNIVCFKGKYAYQLTDKIHSDLYFKKRKKLVTL
jgi:hypothetical protein